MTNNYRLIIELIFRQCDNKFALARWKDSYMKVVECMPKD